MTSSTKPFDPTKPVITRDGRKARIICTDRVSSAGFSIVALVLEGATEKTNNYTSGGKLYSDTVTNGDLINVPEVTRILVFTNSLGYVSSQVLTNDGEPGELLIARKKAEGTFLKIVEVEL